MQAPERRGAVTRRGKLRAKGVKSGRWSVRMLFLSVPQDLPRPKLPAPRLAALPEPRAGGGE